MPRIYLIVTQNNIHYTSKPFQDEVRISKTVYDTEIGIKYGGQPLWHHVKCFAEDRANLLYIAGGEDLPGFKLLTKEDQEMVRNEIKWVLLFVLHSLLI